MYNQERLTQNDITQGITCTTILFLGAMMIIIRNGLSDPNITPG